MGKYITGRNPARWLALAFGFIFFFALLTSALTMSFSAAEEIAPSDNQAGSSVPGQSDNTSSDAAASDTSDTGTDSPESSPDSSAPGISETDNTAGEQPAAGSDSSGLPDTDGTASDSSESSSSQDSGGPNPPGSQTEPDSSSVTPETGSAAEGTGTPPEMPAAVEPQVEAKAMEAEPTPAPVIGNVDVPGYFPYDTTVGGFVFEFENFYGNDFFAAKIDEGTPVPKADVGMFNVSSSGFRLFKNFNDDSFGDYCWILTADNMFTLASNLNIHTSEMYSEQLLDVSGSENPVLFPSDYWTTEPENDLVSRLNGTPIQAIQGSDTKFNAHLYRGANITFSNFILSVEPGHQTTYAE